MNNKFVKIAANFRARPIRHVCADEAVITGPQQPDTEQAQWLLMCMLALPSCSVFQAALFFSCVIYLLVGAFSCFGHGMFVPRVGEASKHVGV